MTDEIPVERGIRCTECDKTVYLARQDNNTLAARCGCGNERSIKVATLLPEGWSA